VGQRRVLTLVEREEISRGLAAGLSNKDIAGRVGRCPSVVSRERRRHGGIGGYRACAADRAAAGRRRRPKTRKLDRCPRLRERVVAGLAGSWSPQQVAAGLRCEPVSVEAGPVAVSHQAIYEWIYARPKGELRRLAEQQAVLRTGRTTRRPKAAGPVAKRVRIAAMTSIDERPAEAADRRVPGHWEGDLLIGKAGRTAMGTLVERTSRYLIPVPLPAGKDSQGLKDALLTVAADLPRHLFRSLTWDCGTEMAAHAAFTLATDVKVYFAHPHSPWERGTNENTNRWLREYFPKGTDIPADPDYLWAVAREINGRPRKILDWKKPAEVFAGLLTSEIASTG
jgi:transposase, IS30 family